MVKIAFSSFVILATAAFATAGQIELGGTNGLTSSYVTSNGGSTGGATEQNYNNVLFSGATNGTTAPKAYSTYNQTTAETGTIKDSAANGGAGVTFSMIDDGFTSNTDGVHASNNYWALPQTETGTNGVANPTMVIPVGVYGVTDVWALLNTALASSGAKDVAVTFDFGTTATGGTTQAVLLKLTDSANSSTASGEVTNAVDCIPQSGSCLGTATTTPANGPTLAGPTAISGVNVYTDSLYTYAFSSVGGCGSQSCSGNLNLSDIGFVFNNLALTTIGSGDTNLNTYLVNIKIQEFASTNVGQGIALSAITLDAVPEPSTVLLFLTGLGALGLARRRRSC